MSDFVELQRLRKTLDWARTSSPTTKAIGRAAGALRGGSCNMTLGHMRDSPELLRDAADYLEATFYCCS